MKTFWECWAERLAWLGHPGLKGSICQYDEDHIEKRAAFFYCAWSGAVFGEAGVDLHPCLSFAARQSVFRLADCVGVERALPTRLAVAQSLERDQPDVNF
ncbi:hypothetical protein J3458_003548 [Metarhizium acridum]|uniref:uncharacterized protein n=1 Tax=Metarhizium acridum TaxID=92637 RepID=UPI001C6CCD29|nr:hypothetical protein J3458_003548 [Metarhizium acridum]